MIRRDRDTDNNGTLDERLYVLHDANFNVTGLVNTSGTVVERFTYEPFGKAEIRDASWSIKSGGTGYVWLYLHQGGRFNGVSGLYAFRMREYSPTLGRWMTNDPIGYRAGDDNLYRSVFNNPNVYSDPTGLVVFKRTFSPNALQDIIVPGGGRLTWKENPPRTDGPWPFRNGHPLGDIRTSPLIGSAGIAPFNSGNDVKDCYNAISWLDALSVSIRNRIFMSMEILGKYSKINGTYPQQHMSQSELKDFKAHLHRIRQEALLLHLLVSEVIQKCKSLCGEMKGAVDHIVDAAAMNSVAGLADVIEQWSVRYYNDGSRPAMHAPGSEWPSYPSTSSEYPELGPFDRTRRVRVRTVNPVSPPPPPPPPPPPLEIHRQRLIRLR